MIPEEAVAAAAKGIASANLRGRAWDECDDELRNHFRRDARAALEAAAPHIMAAAWERGREDGYHHRPNPYKETGE
jgi:hypothetical protein